MDAELVAFLWSIAVNGDNVRILVYFDQIKTTQLQRKKHEEKGQRSDTSYVQSIAVEITSRDATIRSTRSIQSRRVNIPFGTTEHKLTNLDAAKPTVP